MQRQIINGVPYFTDAQSRLFTWDAEAQPQHLGTFEPTNPKSTAAATTATIRFNDNHLAKLTDRLQGWRAKQNARSRKPGAGADSSKDAAGGGNRLSQADGEEGAEVDE